MNEMISAMTWLPNMQQLKLWTLCWCSFSGCSREHFDFVFARKGWQYLINRCMQRIGKYKSQDGKPKMVDARLTHIHRMGPWPCSCHFSQSKLPIHWLCPSAIKALFNYRPYITSNCSRSIDAHTPNRAMTVLLFLLPIQAAHTSIMPNSDQSTVQLPNLHNLKVLTLRWGSFSEWGDDRIAVSFTN